MKRRMKSKWVMMVVCGGMLFQVGSCIPIIADILLQQVFVTVVSALVDSAITTPNEEAAPAE